MMNAEKQINLALESLHTIKIGKYLANGRVNIGGVVYQCRTLDNPFIGQIDGEFTGLINGTSGTLDGIFQGTFTKTLSGEVLVAFIDADPNKGVILGVVN